MVVVSGVACMGFGSCEGLGHAWGTPRPFPVGGDRYVVVVRREGQGQVHGCASTLYASLNWCLDTYRHAAIVAGRG